MSHDAVEDQDVTNAEIADLFGPTVASLVVQLTDDKSLPKQVRKDEQIAGASHKSDGASAIKDKTSNLLAIAISPPPWPADRKRAYVESANQRLAASIPRAVEPSSSAPAIATRSSRSCKSDGTFAASHRLSHHLLVEVLGCEIEIPRPKHLRQPLRFCLGKARRTHTSSPPVDQPFLAPIRVGVPQPTEMTLAQSQ